MPADLRYPIGPFKKPESLTPDRRRAAIEDIAAAPAKLRAAVAGLTPDQLGTPYRPGGWTVRQVAHHVPDSHLNAYVRMKLAVTEDEPTIKTYEEKRWAELADATGADVEISLRLLESLHQRWVLFLRSLAPTDFSRRLNHPELGPISNDTLLALYAWHGKHHVAHVTSLRERNGW